jgi:osmotically-inducible protein OsmY
MANLRTRARTKTHTAACLLTVGVILLGTTAAGAQVQVKDTSGITLAQARAPKPPVAPTGGEMRRQGPNPPKPVAAVLSFRLRHDWRLDGSDIRVTAKGHRVGLYGSVQNYHQRRIARQIAQGLPGVTYVADHMRVLTQPPSAADLVATVQARLAAHPETAGGPVQVQARRDVVTLTGKVTTLRVKQAAIRLARSTPRVSVVQDHLTVTPGATGEALAASVRAALQKDRSSPIRSLRVLVNGSYLFLRGFVFSRQAKRRAGDDASSVPGVTGMSNSLTVLPSRIRDTNS